ncbi:MAG: HesB/IscA family protein [Candidatus Xenobium sp.]|jgi:iron-sulfur cluster assembly protein|nr:iron-sulfur cluster assembly accessory protein [Burkholderiales bacterium]
MITATESAVREVKRLMEDHKLKDAVLRMGVRGMTCSGPGYVLGFDQEVREDDQVFESDGLRIVVDEQSYIYLQGTELDFTSDVHGGGFQFNNPNNLRSCGSCSGSCCG